MHGIIIFTAIIFFLWIARSILIPLLVAAFLWYLMNAISDYYRRVLPYKNPTNRQARILSLTFDWLSYIGTIATIGAIVYLFMTQISPMFSELTNALPTIQEKLADLGTYLSKSVGLHFDSNMIPNLTKVAANIGASVAGIATSLGMVLVYLIFMFVEQSTFNSKFAAMFPARRQHKKMRYILDSIDSNMKKYLFVKTAFRHQVEEIEKLVLAK